MQRKPPKYMTEAAELLGVSVQEFVVLWTYELAQAGATGRWVAQADCWKLSKIVGRGFGECINLRCELGMGRLCELLSRRNGLREEFAALESVLCV